MTTSVRGLLPILLASLPLFGISQCDRWQQRVHYTMSADLDVSTHRYTGESTLRYTNNSPDTLREVFFHLYFNAFRPGSEMDVRSRTIEDPDSRVADRIQALAPDEQGELKVLSMQQQGRPVVLEHKGTVLRAVLAQQLLPGKSTTLTYTFEGQVPVQIRRSGRNSSEGVAYSMVQWYPKLAEYDLRGWHAIPYVGREFHAVWGDFDVSLTLDSSYTLAATGVLQKPESIGHGYPAKKPVKRPASDKLTWRFIANDVHDFAWAADPEYVHFTTQVPNGPILHFFHKDDPSLAAVWKDLPEKMVTAFEFMSKHYGAYPWPQYSFVQGGDGGMEYPMLTLVTGKRKIGSLVGVSVHELVHSWFQGMLANNEGRYPWMDEGMTQYAGNQVMQELFPREGPIHASAYAGYFALVESGKQEPASIHADHYATNFAYGVVAYNLGEMLVHQLGAVIGERNVAAGMQRYMASCRFKHPEPIDLERAMEKQSGLELDWYFDQWINTTRVLDDGIQQVLEVDGKLRITIERKGQMLMPVDVLLEQRDGSSTTYHIPLSLSLGARPAGSDAAPFTVLPAWQWTDPTYTFEVPGSLAKLAAMVLDPMQRSADVDRSNDRIELPEGAGGLLRP